MSKSLFCGGDVASDNNTIWLMLDDGSQPGKLFSVDNNQLGAEVLAERVYNIAKEHCVSDVLIGTEATSMYDWHLLEYLTESKLALEFNLKLYRFNAKWIKNFKKSLALRGKTDPIDSFAIAERLRMERLPKEYVPDTKYQPLRKLTRFRFHLMQQIARGKDFFLANLFLKASAYSQVAPFGSTFSSTSLAVINDFFSVDELAAMPIEAPPFRAPFRGHITYFCYVLSFMGLSDVSPESLITHLPGPANKSIKTALFLLANFLLASQDALR